MNGKLSRVEEQEKLELAQLEQKLLSKSVKNRELNIAAELKKEEGLESSCIKRKSKSGEETENNQRTESTVIEEKKKKKK